jgi:hypothetical protein
VIRACVISLALGLCQVDSASCEITADFTELWSQNVEINFDSYLEVDGLIFSAGPRSFSQAIVSTGTVASRICYLRIKSERNVFGPEVRWARPDGKAFTPKSIHISEVPSAPPGQPLKLVGTRNGKTVMQKSITLDGILGFQVVNLTDFPTLTDFSIDLNEMQVDIDDFKYDVHATEVRGNPWLDIHYIYRNQDAIDLDIRNLQLGVSYRLEWSNNLTNWNVEPSFFANDYYRFTTIEFPRQSIAWFRLRQLDP